MFKKNIAVQTSRDLSGKDVKTLKKDIKLNFPDLTDEQVSDLIPNKAEVSLLKLSNRAQAYSCNGKNPLFFDPEGRGDLLVPSVYVLWRYPHILSSLTTYSEVSPKVLGGADLFLQGLIVPEGGLGTFSAGDLRTVVCPGNKFPFAVGLLEVSSEQVAKTGLAGRGLKLLHHYPDQLWGLGDKTTPDKSFTPSRVFPQASTSSPDRQCLQEPASQNGASTNGSSPAAAEPPVAKAGALALSDEDEEEEEEDEEESAPSNSAGAGGPSAVSAPQTPDSIFESCLMTGLHLVPDNELPMLTSTFSAKYMMQGRPADTAVDIKKTSYKKLSKLLSTFEKKGLLQVKLVHKQDHLATVNRQHALYAASAGASEAAKEAASAAEPSAAEARQGAASTSSLGTVDIAACYRVPSSLRPIFGSNLQPPDHLYSAEDVAAALKEYAHQNGLSGASEAGIKLDRFLVAYVFNKKDPQQEGDAHAFDDLLQRLLHKLTLYNKVTRSTPQGNMETVQRGAIKSIAVAMEDRHGGRKHITRVAHCESFSIDPAELAGLLQRKFKTSASVQKLPGKQETGKEIALQGDLLHDIPKFLTDMYGLSPQYIDVKSKGK